MAFPKIEGFVVTEKLGSGSYSTVYKANAKVGGRWTVAIKCIDKSRVKNSASALDNLTTEIHLLKTLKHPHIVLMHDFNWDQRNIYIITEYCCGGDLSRHIQRLGRLPERQVRYFLQQLASALKFMKERGVVHMDLKPHNLLLQKADTGKYILKVADFGFAAYLSADALQNCTRGSPLYMAPEMLMGQGGASADLWSVGVILYECLFGRAPYSSSSLKELMTKIHTKQPITLPSKASVSPGCQDLLSRLLQHDPQLRLTHEEFFSHEYLDLEHMPSKENFDKAVKLMKTAVERDSRGEKSSALVAYKESLRYLVPAVDAEGDAVRRAALRDKVTSYMRRAEELKAQLKVGGSAHAPPPPSVSPSTEIAGTGGEGTGPGDAGEGSGADAGMSDVTTGIAHLDTSQATEDAEPKTAPGEGSAGRAGGGRTDLKKRLFGRAARDESGLADDTALGNCRVT